MERTNVLKIETPEGVVFPILLAGPFVRCAAWFIDCICIIAATIAVGQAISVLALVSTDFAQAVMVLCYFIINVFYYILFEWLWNGRTPGKKTMKLRVLDVQGLSLKPSQVILRNLIRVVDSMPLFYCAGGVALFFSKRYQRLGDYLAQTIVAREQKIGEPNLTGVLSDKYNSFRDFPHLMARLKNAISPDEASIILRALQRRTTLESDKRQQIYAELADCFRDRVVFPQEVTDGLSDERYLRNLIDVLYRK